MTSGTALAFRGGSNTMYYMPEPKKQDIITFKVDPALRRAMRGVENRSQFIRAAILAALDTSAPCARAPASSPPTNAATGSDSPKIIPWPNAATATRCT